jgi:2-haloalkanoic acid dehalogenase type II
MIKAIFFDCYGTLISTGHGSVKATKEILEKSNISIDAELFYKHWKKVHKDNINKLTQFKKEKDIFTDDLKYLYKYYNIKGDEENDVKYMLNSLSKRTFFDGTLSYLKEIRNKYKIYIASNSDTEPLLENIGDNMEFFDDIFTSENLMKYKPSKYFFDEIIKKTMYKNHETVFVGDSLVDDIQGSNNAGLYSILIDRNKKYIEKDIKPDAIINNLNELENAIKEIIERQGYFA